MNAGLYRVPAGEPDRRMPHAEDEVYFVTAGRGGIEIGEGTCPVACGDVVFVERGVEHRFVDVEEDLETLVLFAPPGGASTEWSEVTARTPGDRRDTCV